MADRSRKRTIEDILNSDTDPDESDFEGFSSESDISVGDLSDSDTSGDESSDDEPVLNNEWTRRFSEIEVGDFEGHSGANLPDDFDVVTACPLDFFWLLFSANMFAEIARHTNSYARWRIANSGRDDPYWKETTEHEMRAFVGLEIMMGINPLPDTAMYWSKNSFIGNAGIQAVMTINRYQKLKQYFHVSDRATEPARGTLYYDKLYKLRPVFDHISANFIQRYDVGECVAVDEAMVKFAGKLSFRQYMPAKPIKRGIKIWMACDSKSFFLSRFDVYLGKSQNAPENGLGYSVVTKLVDNLYHSHRKIYFDNFFTSVPLLEFLLSKGLYGCGTVRTNRVGFPKDLKKPRNVKNRGDSAVLQKGSSNLTASVWKDKRLVHHLSTIHQPSDIRQATRRVGAVLINVDQPATVNDYNKYMGGVDQHDQLRMNYSVGRNSKKWWRYLFWFSINTCIVNSFILYKQCSQRPSQRKRFTHLDFRIEMAQDLIGGFSTRKRRQSGPQCVGMVALENIGGHVNCKLDKPKGRCRYHLKTLGIRKETYYGCSLCQVHLCRDGCHTNFHNL